MTTSAEGRPDGSIEPQTFGQSSSTVSPQSVVPSPILPGPAVSGLTGEQSLPMPEISEPESDSPDARNAARIASGLQSLSNHRGGTVTVRLAPPQLGAVRIQLQLQGAAVSAVLLTETASAGALLEQYLGQLRVALEVQGLSVERLNVHTMSSPMNQGPYQQASPDTPQEGRSRVVVCRTRRAATR